MAEEDAGDSAWAALADVERWAAEARAQDAIDARVRERWLRHQAQEEAAFGGLLHDLAEREVVVVVTTTGGRHHTGRVAAVGSDFAAVRTAGDRTTLVALDALAAVRVASTGPAPSPHAASERSSRSLSVTMADVIAHAVARRPRVQVHAGAASVTGELASVGADVVTVSTDGDRPRPAYVRLPSISEISLLDSG